MFPYSPFRHAITHSNAWQESEASATRIELPDDDPAYLYTLLDWLYKSVYTNYTCDIDMPYSVFAVHIYAIADKYGVDALREKAAERLSGNPFSDVYYDDLVGVLRAIEECTNPKDTTLWDIVLPKVKDNINLLLKDEDFTNLICEKPEINLRILKAFGGEGIGGSRRDDTSPERAAASSPTV